MAFKMKGAATLIAALAIFATASAAAAQSGYPDHNVRMLVGYPPGGPVDIIGRVVADRLSQIWGKSVVVENITGAGGNIAADRAVHATPDGYTLLVSTNAQLVVNPSLYKMTFDPAKDLTPISLAVYSPNILVIPNDVPAKSVKELVEYLKAHPGKSFASAGVGTTQHLAGELFKSMAHVDIQHVPYRGAAPVIPDLMAGRVTLFFGAISSLHSAGARGQAARARRHLGQALSGGARTADHDRGRLSRIRIGALHGPGGAGRYAARDRREDSPGHGQRPGRAGGAQEARQHRHGSDRLVAGGIRRRHGGGTAAMGKSHQRRRDQTEPLARWSAAARFMPR